MLVAMAGLPGTGKSTLAASLAESLGGVVLSKDVVRTAPLPAGPGLHRGPGRPRHVRGVRRREAAADDEPVPGGDPRRAHVPQGGAGGGTPGPGARGGANAARDRVRICTRPSPATGWSETRRPASTRPGTAPATCTPPSRRPPSRSPSRDSSSTPARTCRTTRSQGAGLSPRGVNADRAAEYSAARRDSRDRPLLDLCRGGLAAPPMRSSTCGWSEPRPAGLSQAATRRCCCASTAVLEQPSPGRVRQACSRTTQHRPAAERRAGHARESRDEDTRSLGGSQPSPPPTVLQVQRVPVAARAGPRMNEPGKKCEYVMNKSCRSVMWALNTRSISLPTSLPAAPVGSRRAGRPNALYSASCRLVEPEHVVLDARRQPLRRVARTPGR